MIRFFELLDKAVAIFSYWGLIVSVISMLLLTVVSIVLRWVGISLIWIEPVVRHFVFLSAFLGGALAAGRKKHISIDALPRYFEAEHLVKIKRITSRIVDFFSVVVCVWLFFTSFDLVKMEFDYGRIAFLGIHSGYLISIIPFGFIMIAYRFFFHFLRSFTSSGASHA